MAIISKPLTGGTAFQPRHGPTDYGRQKHGLKQLDPIENDLTELAEASSPASTGEAGIGRYWDVMVTETVGLPVHALLTANPEHAAVAALDLIDSIEQDVVLVTFVNPGVVPLARRSAAFQQSLREFDIVLPDGIGMCAAMHWLHGLPAKRVSFDTTSLAPALFARARSRRLTIALVGGAPQIAEQARAQIVAHFPGIQITAALDGYGDMAAKASVVRQLGPDIVICGMGSGQQEAFLIELKRQGWRGWGFTCGGYFDQLVGGIAYYPRWIDAANLRWAYRLVREPGRLWRRYFIDYSHFGVLVCAARVRKPRQAPA